MPIYTRLGKKMIAADVRHATNNHLKVVFHRTQSLSTTIELEVWCRCEDSRKRDYLAEVDKIIDTSHYGVPLHAHCEECAWHQLLAVVNRCQEAAQNLSSDVRTYIRVSGKKNDLLADRLEMVSAISTGYRLSVSTAT